MTSMVRSFLLAAALACACALAACHKASAPAAASGPLASEDVTLLKDLPGGNLALVGGNYMKLQDFMNTKMGALLGRMMEKTTGKGEGMTKWMQCFTAHPKIRLVGGVASAGDGMQLRLAMTGMTIADVTTCAKEAGFAATPDADGKFVAVEVPGPGGTTSTPGYLQLADGALYQRITFTIGLRPGVTPGSRADLEADAAAAAKGGAADDKKLLDLAAKTDRTKTVWFAGSAAGTPVGDKLGDVYGTLDITDGVAIDVVAQVLDKSLAAKIVEEVGKVKKSADKMPSELRSVVEDLKLDRDGDRLRFLARITDAQLSAIMKMGALGR